MTTSPWCSPGERDVAMVFQSYALYPHMTVYKNMAFGPLARREPKAEVHKRVVDVVTDTGPGAIPPPSP